MKHQKRTCAFCLRTNAVVTTNAKTGKRIFNLTLATNEAKHSLALADLAIKSEQRRATSNRNRMREIRLEAYKSRSLYHVNTLLRIESA